MPSCRKVRPAIRMQMQHQIKPQGRCDQVLPSPRTVGAPNKGSAVAAVVIVYPKDCYREHKQRQILFAADLPVIFPQVPSDKVVGDRVHRREKRRHEAHCIHPIPSDAATSQAPQD